MGRIVELVATARGGVPGGRPLGSFAAGVWMLC